MWSIICFIRSNETIMEFLIFVIAFLFIIYNFRKIWVLHLLINGLLVFSYIMMLILLNTPQVEGRYTDRGLGVAIFIMFSYPIYLIIALFSIYYFYKNKFANSKKIIYTNVIGLIFSIILLMLIFNS